MRLCAHLFLKVPQVIGWSSGSADPGLPERDMEDWRGYRAAVGRLVARVGSSI